MSRISWALFTQHCFARAEDDGIEGESRTAKTELTNHRLHFALTKTSWLLLNRLVVRWSSAFESSGQQRSSDNFDIPDEVPGASRQGGSIAVFADVVDDAFSSKRYLVFPTLCLVCVVLLGRLDGIVRDSSSVAGCASQERAKGRENDGSLLRGR